MNFPCCRHYDHAVSCPGGRTLPPGRATKKFRTLTAPQKHTFCICVAGMFLKPLRIGVSCEEILFSTLAGNASKPSANPTASSGDGGRLLKMHLLGAVETESRLNARRPTGCRAGSEGDWLTRPPLKQRNSSEPRPPTYGTQLEGSWLQMLLIGGRLQNQNTANWGFEDRMGSSN